MDGEFIARITSRQSRETGDHGEAGRVAGAPCDLSARQGDHRSAAPYGELIALSDLEPGFPARVRGISRPGRAVWRTDGTEQGTEQLGRIGGTGIFIGSNWRTFFAVGTTLFL